MKILITNDDGLQAPQLVPLIRWCRKLGEVTAVVPKQEQSGKSHSIELHRAIEAKQVALAPDVTVWAVDSSPADCVRFAVLGMKMQFDLVISGINRGLNMGVDILYSGTVGAVFEAAALGIPGLAISTTPGYYSQALSHMDRIMEYIHRNRLLSIHPIYNINIPPQAGDIRITHQGGPYYSDDFPMVSPDLYMPTGKCVYIDRGDDTLDTDAVKHGFLSIMPLTIERTDMAVYRKLTNAE